jgi:radical SAM superfamily enzyme YgiQ (UPF0313 family)
MLTTIQETLKKALDNLLEAGIVDQYESKELSELIKKNPLYAKERMLKLIRDFIKKELKNPTGIGLREYIKVLKAKNMLKELP